MTPLVGAVLGALVSIAGAIFASVQARKARGSAEGIARKGLEVAALDAERAELTSTYEQFIRALGGTDEASIGVAAQLLASARASSPAMREVVDKVESNLMWRQRVGVADFGSELRIAYAESLRELGEARQRVLAR